MVHSKTARPACTPPSRMPYDNTFGVIHPHYRVGFLNAVFVHFSYNISPRSHILKMKYQHPCPSSSISAHSKLQNFLVASMISNCFLIYLCLSNPHQQIKFTLFPRLKIRSSICNLLVIVEYPWGMGSQGRATAIPSLHFLWRSIVSVVLKTLNNPWFFVLSFIPTLG